MLRRAGESVRADVAQNPSFGPKASFPLQGRRRLAIIYECNSTSGRKVYACVKSATEIPMCAASLLEMWERQAANDSVFAPKAGEFK